MRRVERNDMKQIQHYPAFLNRLVSVLREFGMNFGDVDCADHRLIKQRSHEVGTVFLIDDREYS